MIVGEENERIKLFLLNYETKDVLDILGFLKKPAIANIAFKRAVQNREAIFPPVRKKTMRVKTSTFKFQIEFKTEISACDLIV